MLGQLELHLIGVKVTLSLVIALSIAVVLLSAGTANPSPEINVELVKSKVVVEVSPVGCGSGVSGNTTLSPSTQM